MSSAITRWVQYETSAAGDPGLGGTEGLGTRKGYIATGASGKDVFSIGSGNNRLHVTFNDVGGTPFITLVSGTDLDPRFLARDITEKLHFLGLGGGCDHAQCVWENGKFVLYSGSLGSGSSVTVVSGINTAHLDLGWGTKTEVGGAAAANAYDGGITVSGTYNGFFDETYKIVINKENSIQSPVKVDNSYTGTISTGGSFSNKGDGAGADLIYTLSINTTHGTTMGGGTGGVPTLSWTSTGSHDDGGPVELLYPDYWYNVGTKGLMVKFTEGVFSTSSSAWTITCNWVRYAAPVSNTTAAAGSAMYHYGSTRGDHAATSIVCLDDDITLLGSRGLYIKFVGTPADHFAAGDEFYVVCKPPQPMTPGITNVNYGNVTVSTESAVKCVMFEIMSGAIEISTVKFGLQSHGTFEHHNEVNEDTYFRFGTVGPGQNADPANGLEWKSNVVAADIASDVAPAGLYATKENLAVVSDADGSEIIGSSGYMGMTSDPIFINVRLGASEVGANSTINLRCFFDYS